LISDVESIPLGCKEFSKLSKISTVCLSINKYQYIKINFLRQASMRIGDQSSLTLVYYNLLQLSTNHWWTIVKPNVGEYCQNKTPELAVKGRIIYIGSCKLCLETYSNSSIGRPLLGWCPKKKTEMPKKRASTHIYTYTLRLYKF